MFMWQIVVKLYLRKEWSPLAINCSVCQHSFKIVIVMLLDVIKFRQVMEIGRDASLDHSDLFLLLFAALLQYEMTYNESGRSLNHEVPFVLPFQMHLP